jgi:hypothetical protein
LDTWQVVGTALGLGLLSGIRLYLTVFMVGLGFRFGWFHLPESLAGLSVLGDDKVLIVAGVATIVEFLADKIPWVDSLWDSIHTFIRPIGAALLGSAFASGLDPALRMAVALVVGGVAFTGHSSKAATRLMVNHSPEPFSNIALSLMGDMAVPLGVWFTTHYPLLALGIVALFVLSFAWLAPKIVRMLRVEMRALGALFGRVFASGPRKLEAIPAELREAVTSSAGSAPEMGLECIATRSVGNLANSIGWLGSTPTHLIFVTRRGFRTRVHAIPLPAVRRLDYERGLILHSLTVNLGDRVQRFDLFAGTPPSIVSQLLPGATSEATRGRKAYA